MPRGVRAGLAVLVLAALAPLPAFGQDAGVSGPVPLATVPSGERSRLADELETITAGEADVLRRVAEARARHDEQTKVVARLDDQIRAVGQRMATARRDLAAAEARTARADRAVLDAQRRVDEARQRLERHALAAYIGHGQLPALSTSFAAADGEAQVALRYAAVASEVRAREVRSFRAERDALVDLEEEAATARAAARRQREDLAAEADRLASQRTRQEAAREAAADALAKEQALATDLQVTKLQVTQRLDRLKAESAALADLIRQRGSTSGGGSAAAGAARPLSVKPAVTTAPPPRRATSGPPVAQAPATTAAAKKQATTTAAPATTAAETSAKATTTTAKPAPTTAAKATTTVVLGDEEGAVVTGKAPGPYSTNAPPAVATALRWPIPGAPLVSRFGMRVQPVLGVYRMHEGIDIWAPSGTPIQAAGAGTVIWAGPRGGYGIAVVIDHGNGLSTIYAHNSALAVGVGDVVSQGQTISYVGATGLAGGPHLHLEVRIDGVAYDPLRFVQRG